MAETEQLRLEIVADDKTAAVLAAVKMGYAHLAAEQEKHAKKATPKPDSFLSKIGGGVAMGIGMGIAHAVIRNVEEIAHEIPALLGEGLAEAIGDAAQVHDLAGQFLLLSDGTKGFNEMKEAATAYHEEIEALAADTGKDVGQLSEAFNSILYSSEKSTDAVMELTTNIALASKVVPGGIQSISEGMKNLEMGMVKAKNPVVQLIAATNLLHGNAKEVAKQMVKMSPKEQAELAEKAIAKMADRAKAMPMSFGEMQTSLKNIKDMALEALGYPLYDAIMPALSDFTRFMQEHREELEGTMEEIGDEVAGELTDVFKIAKDGFNTLRTHSKDFKEAGGYFRDALKESAEVMKAVLGGVAGATVALTQASNAVMRVPSWLGQMDSVFGRMYQAHKNEAAGKDAAKEFGASPATMTPDQMRVAKRMTMGGVLAGGGTQEEAERAWAQAQTNHRIENETMGAPIEQANAELNPAIYAGAFNRAAAFHDEAAMEYAAQVIAGSEGLQKAFLESRTTLEDGYQPLIDLVKDKNRGFAEALVRLQKDNAKSIGAKVTQNFYGGVNIKQDFRDNADPDRIIQMFRRDLVQQAGARRSSRLATAFGI